ncbi:sensor histidine kinase [Salinimicrobium xinjiangense]|uniref:sensor histidine kinase n=1 Tax=Salinimicrobium xinjiangense TaxID=438596 RepID=UPI00040B50E5|nr:sensor histidine kinase [Salinimicrobium xinjiangense]
MKYAAQVLKNEKEIIINTWIDQIKEDVSATRNTSRIVLRDHVPQLLDDIIRVMDRFDKFDVVEEEMIYREIFESSVEHGRHRATSEGYSLGQILREYILFDKVITVSLIDNKAFSKEAGMVIKYSIENAMLYSAIAFTDSLQEMRHKLIAMVAHDMRNPISAALFAVKAMKYEDGPERFDKIKEMAITSLGRSVDLIEGLLDSVTIQAGEGMIFNFSQQNIVDYLQAVYQEAKQSYSNPFILECDEKEISGVFDGTMVRRVLENFINNAVKYGRRNGPISLSCKNNGDVVEFSVHNEGNPIPAEKQEAIFEFLDTSEGLGPLGLKSRGIGLYLVKAVAEAHSGELRLKSSEEEGTTFSISLHKSSREPGKFRGAVKK